VEIQHILVILTSLRAEGTPVLALNLARTWTRQGLRVSIATLYSEPSDLLGEYQREGFQPHCLGISTDGPEKFLLLAARARAICRLLQPDVFLSFPFGWHSLLGYGARSAGVRAILTHAGNFPPASDPRACHKISRIVRLGAPLRPHVVCCSNYVRSGVRQYYEVGDQRLHTVYNGVDLDAYRDGALNRSAKASPGVVRCGMVATLEPHKDHATLVRGAAVLRDCGLPLQMEFAGDGSLRGRLEQLVRQHGLEPSVSFLGMRRDVRELLASWDLFLFSTTQDEGLGIALIEAMAAGVPVIASDVGACREVLCPDAQKPLGELVEPGSPKAVADAVHDFCRNRDAWLIRAQEAQGSAQQRFSTESMAQGYLKVMELATAAR
jgi:glycosyltransferase involved in cell wall biosynthesis